MDEIIGRILFGFFWIFLFISYYGREIIFIISMAFSIIVIAMICNAYKVKNAYKLLIIVFVISCISVIYLKQLYDEKVKKQIAETKKQEERAKRDIARAIFDEQCQKAGEQIYRTVDNVDGIMLLKVLGENPRGASDNMWEDAVFGEKYPKTPEEYIRQFLSYDLDYNVPNQQYHYWKDGYLFVDVLEKNSHSIIDRNYVTRYTRVEPIKESELNRNYPSDNPARYAVTYENNVNPELRKYWIAGSTIKIIDRQTDELLAEKVIFVFDRGQGFDAHYYDYNKKPWYRAIPCENSDKNIKNFVLSVLKPRPLVLENEIPEQSIQKQ